MSRFEAATYEAKIGQPRAPATVVPNGIRPEEFEPVALTPDAADFLFVGTLRDLKGPDVFIEALARLRAGGGKPPSAVIVGGGVDKPGFVAMAAEHGLADAITFHDPMPAREAFRLGRIMVIPSRAESMPYIVLETIAAGRPLIATRVGGIPEIYGDESGRLIPPGNVDALATAMAAALAAPEAAEAAADGLRSRILSAFSVATMASAIETVYRSAIAR